MEYATYLSAYANNQTADYQAIFYTHTGTTPTAVVDSFMLPDKLNNRARLNSPIIVEKYEAAISTTDEAEQARLIREISIEYLRQVPVIPLPVANNYIYYWPWLKNYYGEVQVGCYKCAPVHARIWIDRDLKKKMGY